MVYICSKFNWSPLHEAVYMGSGKLVHILMRKGADPHKLGTRDEIEKYHHGRGFGPRYISPNMISKTFNQKTKKILETEIQHRTTHGICPKHNCEDEKCKIDIEEGEDVVN